MDNHPPLWPHQEKAIELARSKRDLALFMGIGVGKTRTLIEILREEFNKQGRLLNTLIFSPLSVCHQWSKEFAKFSNIDEADILVLTDTGVKRTRKLSERRQPCIVITNYESVRIKTFYEALLKWSPHILVLDESHRIKDSSSKQAECIYPLASGASRRFLLTGTPILNSLLDIFGQYKALDATIFGGNFWKFKSRYFYDKNAGMPARCHFPDWQPRSDASQMISQSIASTSVQAKREECLSLPPLHKIQVSVTLSAEQRKAYEDMRKHFVAEIKDVQTIAEFAMTKTLRMQQIIAGFLSADSESEPRWVDDNPRLEALSELLKQINGEKVIIWTTFRPTYSKIGEVCEKEGYKVEYLTGDQSASQKAEAVEQFCRGDAACLVANPSAGGTGINLQEAMYSIYYARGYSLEHYLQSEGRNYRAGSEAHTSVVHYHLVADDTLDEVIAEALLNKQNVSDRVLTWARQIGKPSGKE